MRLGIIRQQKQFLISRAQTKLYRNTSRSVTYVLTTKKKAGILTKIMLTYAGHNGKVYGYQEEVVRFSPNEFRFYGLIKTMFFYDIF